MSGKDLVHFWVMGKEQVLEWSPSPEQLLRAGTGTGKGGNAGILGILGSRGNCSVSFFHYLTVVDCTVICTLGGTKKVQ